MLAKFLGISAKEFLDRCTTSEEYGKKRVRALRHSPDKLVGGTSCMFLNKKTRRCKVYKSRPQICRDYPGDSTRCEWYDRLTIESIGAKSRKVIRLVQMPGNIDGDRPQYENDNLGELLESYAHGDGIWPVPKRARRKRAHKAPEKQKKAKTAKTAQGSTNKRKTRA